MDIGFNTTDVPSYTKKTITISECLNNLKLLIVTSLGVTTKRIANECQNGNILHNNTRTDWFA